MSLTLTNKIRISRTVSGVEHKYQLNGTQIVSETWGIHTIFYIYDELGGIAGMRYRTSSYAEGVFDEYLFEKNLQGDVVAVYNSSGTKLVSYTYDSWGKVTTTYTNSGASTGARYNPFKYRGYYHDDDTGLYYLNTRYYDPSIGRWISPEPNVDYGGFDTGAGLLCYNVYAYCANNPVMFKDETGESITLTCVLIGAGIGLLIGAIGGEHYAKHVKGLNPNDGWDYWKYVVFGGVGGGALGGLAGWAFAGTNVAASVSWAYYKATTAIGTSAYAIGTAFERWFYKAYNVVEQQVRYMGYRFDAIYKGSIVELKNYNWGKYSNFNSLIKSFTKQATNYMQFIGDTIRGQEIKGVTFCFSSKPPQEIIDALRAIGVTVNWLN